MSMGNTGGTRPPQRKASRWKGVLFGWSVLFGLGFVGGLQATKKVAKEGHPLLQKVMGHCRFDIT